MQKPEPIALCDARIAKLQSEGLSEDEAYSRTNAVMESIAYGYRIDIPQQDRLFKRRLEDAWKRWLEEIEEEGKEMRGPVNWNEVKESDGTSQKLPAGAYVARITSVHDEASKEYLEFIFDIAEGDQTGFFSDSWGAENPWAHHFFASYKDTALGMLKHRLNCFTKSNPGFDAMAAFNGAQLPMFLGKLIGINVQEEEYKKGDGTISTRMNVAQFLSADDVRGGNYKLLPIKKLAEDSTKAAQPTIKPDTDCDIPFM